MPLRKVSDAKKKIMGVMTPYLRAHLFFKTLILLGTQVWRSSPILFSGRHSFDPFLNVIFPSHVLSHYYENDIENGIKPAERDHVRRNRLPMVPDNCGCEMGTIGGDYQADWS